MSPQVSGPLSKKQAEVKLQCFVLKWAARKAKRCLIWPFYCHNDVLMGGGNVEDWLEGRQQSAQEEKDNYIEDKVMCSL